MKQTQKYIKAKQTLTFPHSNQEELYQELNRLGFYWNIKTKHWERNDLIAKDATKLIKIRVTFDKNKIEQLAELLIESLQDSGLTFIEKSEPYINKPPNQNDARIYLTFEDDDT